MPRRGSAAYEVGIPRVSSPCSAGNSIHVQGILREQQNSADLPGRVRGAGGRNGRASPTHGPQTGSYPIRQRALRRGRAGSSLPRSSVLRRYPAASAPSLHSIFAIANMNAPNLQRSRLRVPCSYQTSIVSSLTCFRRLSGLSPWSWSRAFTILPHRSHSLMLDVCQRMPARRAGAML